MDSMKNEQQSQIKAQNPSEKPRRLTLFDSYKSVCNGVHFFDKQDIPKDILKQRRIFGFKIRISIDKELSPSKNKRPKQTLLRTQHSDSETKSGLNCLNTSTLDFIWVSSKLGLVDEFYKKEQLQFLDVTSPRNLPGILTFIANPLANGLSESKKSMSYRYRTYPLGVPTCSYSSSDQKAILNVRWKSERVDMTPTNRVKIIYQVPDALGVAEDQNAELDVQIAQNMNAIRLLSEYGFDYAYTTRGIIYEFESMFGNKGPLFVELARHLPKQFGDTLISYLERKAIILGRYRNKLEHDWSIEVENAFPASRAQFQKTPKVNQDYSSYIFVQGPIEYDRVNVSFLVDIVDQYCKAKMLATEKSTQAEIDSWKMVTQKSASLLRLGPGTKSQGLNLGDAVAVCGAALLIGKLKVVRALESYVTRSRSIAREIGLTDPYHQGAARVFSTAIDHIVMKKKMKEGIMEIAGLFPRVDVNMVAEIIKAMIMAIKTMKYAASYRPNEGPVVVASFTENSVQFESLWGTPIALNLEKYKPKEVFR